MKFTMAENEGIKAFFEGSDDYIPTSELKYLHIHPLVRPSFLTEIEALVKKTGDVILSKNIQGNVVTRLEDIVINLGRTLPEINDKNAEPIMRELRNLYSLCNEVLFTYK